MPLRSGARLGPYEIVALLGAGGMGEVYRATDTNLKRAVAIKVLPESVADDAERLARFQREAEVLAALNHPNIAHIHGLEKSGGVTALVMELVEGQTLQELLVQPPATSHQSPRGLPLNETIAIARQIAEALEAAHEQGIIHRDLKPANIKVRDDGTVKVLDFGLAKMLDPLSAEGKGQRADTFSQSPTITTPAMTQAGMILGTAAYMSPEQASGKLVDKRADIWSFGVVLWEMLTGRRLFDGETVSHTLADVLRGPIEFSQLPADTPKPVAELLRRCLNRDAKRRMRDIGEARIRLEEALSGAGGEAAGSAVSAAASAVVVQKRRERIAWAVAAVGVLAALAVGIVVYRQRFPSDAQTLRVTVLPPDDATFSGGGATAPVDRFALSPDGRRLAFVARGTDQRTGLWVRRLDQLTAQALAGTDGASSPFWSPDSRFIAFYAGGKLKKIDASGGPPLTLTDASQTGGGTGGGTWNRDDVILFSPNGGAGVFRISASGGVASPVTTLAAGTNERGHVYPFFLPDGHHFLYLSRGTAASPSAVGGVYVATLDSKETKKVFTGGANTMYAQGALVFLRDATLMAQGFDVRRLELTGDAVPIAEGLELGGLTGAFGAFAVSETGLLAYQARGGDFRSQLTWFDRTGKQLARVGEPADQMNVELSPDGTKLAVSVLDPATNTRDFWIYDLARDNLRTRFTFDPADDLKAVWSPNSGRLIFNSTRKGSLDLYQKASTGAGAEEPLLAGSTNNIYPTSWSADGKFLLYYIGNASSPTGNDLWLLSLEDGKPTPLLQAPSNQVNSRFSPDGRWIAYQSSESGRPEVYVMPFDRAASNAARPADAAGGKWQVSSAGGANPRWRRDGKELFYLSADNKLMAATVNGQGSAFQVEAVQTLFEAHPRLAAYLGYGLGLTYDVSPDGQRFIVNAAVSGQTTAPITLVVNWAAATKK